MKEAWLRETVKDQMGPCWIWGKQSRKIAIIIIIIIIIIIFIIGLEFIHFFFLSFFLSFLILFFLSFFCNFFFLPVSVFLSWFEFLAVLLSCQNLTFQKLSVGAMMLLAPWKTRFPRCPRLSCTQLVNQGFIRPYQVQNIASLALAREGLVISHYHSNQNTRGNRSY